MLKYSELYDYLLSTAKVGKGIAVIGDYAYITEYSRAYLIAVEIGNLGYVFRIKSLKTK